MTMLGKKRLKKNKGFKRKKVSSIEEKVKKGVALNQTERRIMRKKKKKGDFMKYGVANDTADSEYVLAGRKRRHSGSESSFGSPPPKRSDGKRVSFAEKLEHTKLFHSADKRIRAEPSSAEPGKSILAKKAKGTKDKMKTVEKIGHPADGQNEKVLTTETTGERMEAHSGTAVKKNTFKKKIKLQVTRKTKEKLLAMPKKERKAFIKELQKKRKPNFELAVQCKKLWEKIRRVKCNEDEREKCTNELYGLVKGKAKELIYAHDTCRVIECLMSLPRPGIRTALFQELTSEIVRMAKSKYARFFVSKMLRYGTSTQRATVIEAFSGHCVALMRISWAAQVLETAYNDYANALQRSNIIIEFYGKEFILFKAENDKITTLKEIIENDPSKKVQIMKNLEELLKDIVSKPQLKLSLTHRLLNEYLTYCNEEQRTEMIDSLKDRIPEIIHTNDGSHIAMRCIWNGTAKERKMIVKNFKGLVVQACCEEYGHRVLIAIFDAVDDTVLTNKYIIQEISSNIRAVAMNRYGARVIYYLVHPRDARFFGKGSLEIFQKGDNNKYSKKDAKERYAQLFAGLAKPLYSFLAGSMEDLIFERTTALLVLNSLEHSENTLFERTVDDEDRLACYEAIASICKREFIPCDAEGFHAIEHPQAHFVISKLLSSDPHFSIKLSDSLAKLPPEALASWISCNKGCFVLLHMFEGGTVATQKLLARTITISSLKNYSTKGAAILLNKLRTVNF